MTPKIPLELVDVTRRFGAAQALSEVSFDVEPGEVVGLLGPNGAGKTTTMRIITGYLQPSSGHVRVGDAEPNDAAVRSQIGYVPESAPLYGDMLVASYLRFWARLRGLPRSRQKPAVGAAMRQAGLAGLARRPIATLSRGLRQRVCLAQALVHDPAVLVLDEPTTGLDPRQVTETRELIARLGRSRTVLLSSHLLSEVAQLCKRVVVLDRGRVIAVGDVAELTGPDGSLEEAYLRLVQD